MGTKQKLEKTITLLLLALLYNAQIAWLSVLAATF